MAALLEEHLPPLAGGGIRAFHIGSPARTGGSFAGAVDSEMVRAWRDRVGGLVR